MKRFNAIQIASAGLLLFLIACGETAKEPVLVSSITLNPTTLSLTEGDTETIKATVLPENADDKTVSWESSNTSVASVKDGVVSAIAAGNATITAKAGGKSASCAVVVAPLTIDVTSVELNKVTLQMNKGASETLVATVKPSDATEKTVNWSSSDSAVASVSQNGEVSALSKGNATITASAGGKSATCDVQVSVPLEALAFSVEDNIVIDDVQGHELRIIPVPEDASIPEISWSIKDDGVVSLSQQSGDGTCIVSAVNNGETTIVAKANGSSIEASLQVTVKVKATSIRLGAEWFSYRYNSWSWQEIYGSYETTYNVPVYLTIDVEPSIAYIDDAEITIEDDTIVTMNAAEDDLQTKSKEGNTLITIEFPYSGVSKSFMLYVKEYLYDAGVKNVNQSEVNYKTITKMTFGGRIYSMVEEDKFYVDNVQFCDNEGRIIGSSMSPTEQITISRNGTNNVAFSTPVINITELYGFGTINSDLYTFLGKCFFYVTYRKTPSGQLMSKYLYLNENNWNADYDY